MTKALLGGSALGAAAGCDHDEPPPTDGLAIATAPVGEAYERLGSALAGAARARWKIPVTVLNTTDSVENLRRLADGTADVAFTTVDIAAVALEGHSPFAAGLPVAALASLYDDYLHIVVRREDPKIRWITDLKTVTVSTGVKDSAAEIVARRVLGAAGFFTDGSTESVQSLSTADAAVALEKRSIGAFFFTGGLPDETVAQLATRIPIDLVPVEDQVGGSLRERFGDYLVIRSIPAGTYGIPGDVVTLGIRTLLVVRRDMPDRLAYRLVRLLFEARRDLERAHPEAQRLDPRSALSTSPVNLHPGVQAYYREVKPMA